MPLPTPPVAPEPMVALNAGIDSVEAPDTRAEKADVDKWMRKIKRTIAFDENFLKEIVRSRKYARGDSGFVVDANIIGTNIDILESFIYARNPDVDITPAKAVEMPSQDVMLEAAMDSAQNDPRVEQAVQQAQMQALAASVMGGPPPAVDPGTGQVMPSPTPEEMVETARAATIQMIAAENYAKIKAEYQRRTRENKAYAETGELVVSSMWKDGRLKDRGRPWVRSSLTTAVGVLKASWQQRTAPSPQTQSAINDLVQQKERLVYLRKQVEADETAAAQHDEQIAELEQQLQAIQSQADPVVSKGYVIDRVAPENFVVAPGFTIADHMDAPWNAERIPMEFEEACSTYDLSDEDKKQLTLYVARKPVQILPESANLEDPEGVDPRMAEQFVRGDADVGADDTGSEIGNYNVTNGVGKFVMVWEAWDRASNTVLTFIEGLKRYARSPWNPCPTTWFYPYFLFCTSEVDGQRWPQSLVSRSAKLVDEYNRIGSAEAKHRRRIIPKTAFNAGAFGNGEAEKLEKADIQEMVALHLTNPGTDLRTILYPITYAAIDPQLYDRTRINDEIDRIWGISEVLSGGSIPGQTATAADIQQQGFQARTGSRRDAIENTLSHLATYTLEVARKYLTYDEVRDIAGPNAFWPEYTGPEDLRRMLDVEIRAGSTGKPDSRADREAWGAALPQLEKAIVSYGQLMSSSPKDIAESIKKLATYTAEVAGVRLDIDGLFPAPGQPAIDPTTGQPIQPGGPGAMPGGGGPEPNPDAKGGPPNTPEPSPDVPAAPEPSGAMPA